ncbi:MAG TPA: hypothetical protein VKE22_19510 [Haliangiales bacterium]|nr:hypothetical protein [Haliangiales bacterium]
MAGVHELLRAAGIELTADDDRPALRVECARLARRMRERMVRTIGLYPADDTVAVPSIAIELGRALADKSPGSVGVVDAHGSWACARALAGAAPADGTLVATSWITDNLAVLTPRIFDAGAMLGQLRAAVVENGVAFSDLVVDLTGLDHLGDQLAAFELLEAVAVVARSGRTTTRQIQRRLRDIPEWSSLGVLLTGL